MMKYYFQSKKPLIELENNILKLRNQLTCKILFKNVQYIENEIYGRNNLLYPSQTLDYGKTRMLLYNVWEKSIDLIHDFKNYEYIFSSN